MGLGLARNLSESRQYHIMVSLEAGRAGSGAGAGFVIDIWIKVLPFVYAGIWGAQNVLDPSINTIGPTNSMVVGGVGDLWRTRDGLTNQVEGAFTYAYGWSAFNLRPEVSAFATSRGDMLAGFGVNDEYVFKNFSLTPDGATPVFFSWTAGPSYYSPGPGQGGNFGYSLQFHVINEVGVYVNHSTRISVSYDHYSSGGLTEPNPNSNAFLVNLGYKF